jgi:antitoxin (DNA-binding transcriptional repressor) of toxin-antitoxin stability system
MKIYTYSQARQKLSEVLSRSKSEEVLIRRRGGEVFSVKPTARKGSPLDIKGIDTTISTAEILAAVRDVRARPVSAKWKPRRRARTDGK